MQTTSSLNAFFRELYPESFLPPLWRVIYHEGIRGHHLLFDPRDVATFEAEPIKLEDCPQLEETVLTVLSRPDLSSMINAVAALPVTTRRAFYVIYKRTLSAWRDQLKASLN